MIVKSETTGKVYDDKDAVFYRNMAQSAWMLSKSDCELLDIFSSNGKLVCAFPPYLHNRYINEWANRPHESN